MGAPTTTLTIERILPFQPSADLEIALVQSRQTHQLPVGSLAE
jgi:hypothetical protein